MYYGIIFFLLSLIAVYSFYIPSTKYFKIFKAIAFLLLLLTSGLRYETAVDWVNYKRFFEDVNPIFTIFENGLTGFFNEYHTEPLYTLLNSFIRTFTDDIQVLFFVISLITTTLLFKSIQFFSERKYFFFSIMLYYVLIFFVLDMSGIRQCISLNIVLYAFRYLIERKNIRFLLIVVFASLFHFSALIFLFAPLLLGKKIRLSSLLIIMSLGIIIFVFRIRWLTYSIQTIESLYPDNIVVSKIYAYTISNAIYTKEVKIYIMLLINIFLGIVILYGRDRYWKNNVTNSIFFNLLVAYFFFIFVFWEISAIGFRFGLYFILGLIYFLPKIVDFFSKNSRILVLSFIIMYSFMHIRVYILEDKSVITYNPYQNYLIHKIFKIESTGLERRDIYIQDVRKLEK